MPKVTIDGKEHEVELDAITFADDEVPSGFVTTAHLAQEVQRRVGAAKRNARAQLLSDDDFWKEVAAARGIELREDDLMPKGASKDAKALEERLMAQHVNPLRAQLDEANKLVDTLRSKQLESDILRHADGVKKGLRDAFIREVSSRLSLDDETGQFGVKDGDTFKYAADGELYGAKHVIEELRQAAPDWFADTSMKTPDIKGTGPAGRTYTRAEVEEISRRWMATGENKAEFDEATKAVNEGRVQ